MKERKGKKRNEKIKNKKKGKRNRKKEKRRRKSEKGWTPIYVCTRAIPYLDLQHYLSSR